MATKAEQKSLKKNVVKEAVGFHRLASLSADGDADSYPDYEAIGFKMNSDGNVVIEDLTGNEHTINGCQSAIIYYIPIKRVKSTSALDKTYVALLPH